MIMKQPLMSWYSGQIGENDVKIPVTGGYLWLETTMGAIRGSEGDITDVTIPEVYDGTEVTSICVDSFTHYIRTQCDSLASINIPNSVTFIEGGTFLHCPKLSSITVDGNNQEYSSDQQGVLFDKNKTRLIQYPTGRKASSYEIPNTVVEIGWRAFFGCASLASVTIPDSVTSIGQWAFGYQLDKDEESSTGIIEIPGFKIYGYSNDSAAAKYAKETGFEFVIVDSVQSSALAS